MSRKSRIPMADLSVRGLRLRRNTENSARTGPWRSPRIGIPSIGSPSIGSPSRCSRDIASVFEANSEQPIDDESRKE